MEVAVAGEDAHSTAAAATVYEQQMDENEIKAAFMPFAWAAAYGKYQIEDLILIHLLLFEVRDICDMCLCGCMHVLMCVETVCDIRFGEMLRNL